MMFTRKRAHELRLGTHQRYSHRIFFSICYGANTYVSISSRTEGMASGPWPITTHQPPHSPKPKPTDAQPRHIRNESIHWQPHSTVLSRIFIRKYTHQTFDLLLIFFFNCIIRPVNVFFLPWKNLGTPSSNTYKTMLNSNFLDKT